MGWTGPVAGRSLARVSYDPAELEFRQRRYREMLASLDDPTRPFAVRAGSRLHAASCRYITIPSFEDFWHGGIEWRAFTREEAIVYLCSEWGEGTCTVCRPDLGV